MTLDLQKYLTLYVAEAGEHLASLSKDLVRLEEAARHGAGEGARVAIDSCFRHAHSLKGMSASMGLDGIAALAHRLEDLVDVFRREPGRLDPGAIDLLLEACASDFIVKPFKAEDVLSVVKKVLGDA